LPVNVPELIAVALSLAYVVLVTRHHRACWVFGGLSSAIYVGIAASARLPMQSALNIFYVAMSVYGWYSWTRSAREEEGRRVRRWPLARHLLLGLAVAGASLASAGLLARETHAAWPLLDSLVTWTCVAATVLVARSVLENWLYFLAADSVTIFLYARQGHLPSALLFAIYCAVALVGYRAWLRRYRAQEQQR
jgi:nicotinamide mononucleotide transporter